jgi:hypothetical protein
MKHSRKEIIQRTIGEFDLLDRLLASLSEKEWMQPVPRPEGKDSWTVKDTVAHITHFKADAIRSMHRRPKPGELRGLGINVENQVIYLRWRDRSPQEVLAWHRLVQQEVLAALQETPEEWFSGRDRRADWPFDLDGHSAYHRIKDVAEALKRLER